SADRCAHNPSGAPQARRVVPSEGTKCPSPTLGRSGGRVERQESGAKERASNCGLRAPGAGVNRISKRSRGRRAKALAENAPVTAPRAKVARKLYLTAIFLSLLWAVGVLLVRVVPDWPYLSMHEDEALKEIFMAFLPVAMVVGLRRWWRWLRKP